MNTEKEQAIARLREWIKPGDTVYTILRHVSRSGMSRLISMKILSPERGPGEFLDPTYNAAAAMGSTFDRDAGALKIGGCGMDMGFAVVYNLACVLFPDFRCTGKNCPSNDHSNGMKYHKGRKHSDGGYALRQRWL